MRVVVDRVNIPAMSTIGYGSGAALADGRQVRVRFAGDHRPMRHLGEAVGAAQTAEELPVVDLEDWQVLSVDPTGVAEDEGIGLV